MISAHKKFQIPLVSIILLGLALSFAIAHAVLAAEITPAPTRSAFEGSVITKGSTVGLLAGKAFLWGFNGILVGIGSLAAGLVDLAGGVLDTTLEFSLSTLRQDQAIRAGWTISRDIANIFFILIILSIAVATILRIEGYTMKSLLPKLIVAALVINFSLAIGYVIIDATNILALQFYNNIIDKNPARPVSVSHAIMAGTKLSNVFNTELPKDTLKGELSQVGKGVAVAIGAAGAVAACLWLGPVVAAGCGWGAFFASVAAGGGLGALGWAKITGEDIGSAVQFFFLASSTIIFLITVLFVLVAGAIFVIMRSVMLVLLLVLAPIAFMSYAFPIAEKKLWTPWWETFMNQAFFLPAFMFLLYVSLRWVNQIGRDVAAGILIYNPPAVAAMLTSTLMVLLSLLLARKMGILFADSVIKYATMGRKMLAGAVGGIALRNTIGRAGQAMQERGIWQESVFGRRIAGAMFGAGKKLPGGSREQMVKEQAAIAAMKAERDMAEDFAKNPAIRTELMRNRKTPEGLYGLRSNLEKYHPEAVKEFDRLMGTQFTDAERAALEAEKMKHVSKEETYKQFGEMKPSEKKTYIQGMKDADEKARTVNYWEKQAEDFEKTGNIEEAQKARNAAAIARAIIGTTTEADWLEKADKLEAAGDAAGAEKARAAATATRGILSTATEAEKRDFKYADYRAKARNAHAQGKLKEFVRDEVQDKDTADFLEKSTTSDQHVALLDGEASDSALMQRVRTGVNKMSSFEAKDKFHSGLLRSAPDTTVSSYMDSIRAEIATEETAGRTELANAKKLEEERIFANYLSAPQQVALWKEARKDPEKLKRHEAMVSKQATDKVENYNRAFVTELRRSAPEKIAEESFYMSLPEPVRLQWVSDKTQGERVLSSKNKAGGTVANQITEDIKKAGVTLTIAGAAARGSSGKPEVKMSPDVYIQQVEKVSRGSEGYREKLVARIEKSTKEEIKETVTTKVSDTEFFEDVLSAAPVKTVKTIIDHVAESPDLQSAFSKTLRQIAEKLEPKLAGGELTADKLANVFEIKLNNKELAESMRGPSPGKIVWEAILRSRGLKT